MLTWSANGADPRVLCREVGAVLSGLRSLGTELFRPTTHLSVEGLIGPNRRWAAGRCSLSDMKAIRRAVGGSVNDVALAAITGAFRDVLITRHEPVDGVVLRSLVPVSIRPANDHTANNQVSLLIAELPVGIADPIQRLEAIRDQMAELKSSHQATAAASILAAGDFLPAPMLAYGAHTLMRVLRRLPQGAVHTVTTNVPGPQQPLYALGREMLEYLPYVPVSEGVRIGVAIVSYNGQIAFGVTGDYDTAPDVHLMSQRIEDQIALLRLAIGHGEIRKSHRAA
jgi:diacylglycerol O-acyltransferase